MITLTTKLLRGSVGLSVMAACLTAGPAHAEEVMSSQQPASRQQNIGVATGFAVGAVAGGPFGAIVGAAAGAWLGDRYHRQADAHSALVVDLQNSERDRSRLAQHLTEANGSLAREQERGEQLDLALGQTDDLETVVSFRTNADSIQESALPALQKLGAFAAALPDCSIRVAGFADPRGSEAINSDLSKRRAEAVADVLAAAGVDRDRLIVEAHGKSAATSSPGDIDGYAFDRRVTVRIERTGKSAVARNE